MKKRITRLFTPVFGIAAATLVLSSPADAVEFTKGQLIGSWDTTLTLGQAWRLQGRDCNLIAVAHGGCGRSPNIDDGTLNYDRTAFSGALKAVSEVALRYDRFGAFIRGSGLYDYQVMDTPTDRTPLTPSAKDLVGQYTRLLDAFVYGSFALGARPLEVRLGRQVISWGESTFIQGGINTINHFDVSALRVPGSELREAFLPQELAFVSLGLTDNVSLETFYQFDWDDTEPEPAGSFFSTNDFVPDGGGLVFLGFGGFSDRGTDFSAQGGPFIENFQAVPRGPTLEPEEGGQFGAALRIYLPRFMSGTELGFYFINYHSRLPLISGRTGTVGGIANGAGAATAVAGAAQGLGAGLGFEAAIANAANAAVATAAASGGNLDLATATQYATIGATLAVQGAGSANISRYATNLATHEYAQTASYFTEFPEDIKLIGVSFNTQLQRGGIALQGELSYRMDVPLQFDDVEVLFAALSPLEQALFPLSAPPGVSYPTECINQLGITTVGRCNQLGLFAPNQIVKGWARHDTWQFQTTATKVFSGVLGAAQMVLVWEGAITYIEDMPDKLTGGPVGRGLRYNGPGTSVSGNAELASRHCPHLPQADCIALNLVEPQNRFADATSWGYRLASRIDYPNLIGPWNISPRVSWQHDVKGTTPGPGGNFVEGRNALTIGVGGNLRNVWELDLSWTRFAGAGRFNDINDRDFIAAAVRYSF